MRRRILLGAKKPQTDKPWLCFTAEQANSTVAMSVTGTPTMGQSFEYSTDGITWQTFTPGSTTVTLANIGDKMWMRGDNTTVSESSSIYYQFAMTGRIAASGNIMSMIDSACESLAISNSRCFYRMFYDCTSLTTAPELPATTLASNCYQAMFYDCTSLTTAPELPATTLASNCYYSMFGGCTSLYVSDTFGAGYSNAWTIPTSSVATGGSTMINMFANCKGTRSTNSPIFNGIQITYYTQNPPVS